VIPETPNAKALGQLLADPEGNAIELYTPPKP
jgi:hypothetical protein